MTTTILGNLSAPTGVSIIKAEFTGINGAGNVSVPGVKEGDILLTLVDLTDYNYEVSNRTFRSVAPADDVIFQGGGDYSASDLVAILLRVG